MSTRGTRGRGREAVVKAKEVLGLGLREAPASLVTETGSFDRATGDDALPQAMLRILKRVVETSTGALGRGSISERLWLNGAQIFRGVSELDLNMAEYWLEATERIIDDLDPTTEQKLKGVVSLLRDEAYQWWLTMTEGTQADRLTWDFFKAIFQGKYVGTSYVDARRKEFLSLVQGNKTVAEYEAEFL
ncbi:uncharacterized protein LOC105763823 [Gossypium raimondii]|uniref:uncharacterized protein LOC105763823 n=1 Tax=Gossypium raimondii TaxID=29730 RepID=UPI00063ACCE8|nr:uncharacterized protein LOC105763823 [Gossypium raimondii]